jgi:Transcriptional regulator, AbiEi antitoxin
MTAMVNSRPAWQEQLDAQCQVVSLRQALAYGMSRKSVETRTRKGEWQRLHRGTYATFSGEPPRGALLWAAVLRAGGDAVLSHETAAELQGLRDEPADCIHVTVPAGQNPARKGELTGVVVHRSRHVRRQSPAGRLPQLPCTPIEVTVADLMAAAESRDDVYRVLREAIGRRLVTVAAIREEIAARKRLPRRSQMEKALADLDGKGRLLRVLAGSTLDATVEFAEEFRVVVGSLRLRAGPAVRGGLPETARGMPGGGRLGGRPVRVPVNVGVRGHGARSDGEPGR